MSPAAELAELRAEVAWLRRVIEEQMSHQPPFWLTNRIAIVNAFDAGNKPGFMVKTDWASPLTFYPDFWEAIEAARKLMQPRPRPTKGLCGECE